MGCRQLTTSVWMLSQPQHSWWLKCLLDGSPPPHSFYPLLNSAACPGLLQNPFPCLLFSFQSAVLSLSHCRTARLEYFKDIQEVCLLTSPNKPCTAVQECKVVSGRRTKEEEWMKMHSAHFTDLPWNCSAQKGGVEEEQVTDNFQHHPFFPPISPLLRLQGSSETANGKQGWDAQCIKW